MNNILICIVVGVVIFCLLNREQFNAKQINAKTKKYDKKKGVSLEKDLFYDKNFKCTPIDTKNTEYHAAAGKIVSCKKGKGFVTQTVKRCKNNGTIGNCAAYGPKTGKVVMCK